ncbi:MAG: retron St85 family RNA-directed DNA polymerase [Aeromonas veronii]|uniref:retron St85 family RNA-directed DNA polymerase n=1 Tax=Aeromonas TaxID=642 RepID=UPI00288F7A2E|nr:retron St85 family RNA-directed DNA polymerase [Aeromonas dhakensis]HEA3086254.1 retron St85 family RNA-directed DNA polymerase [Aeromonas dhakensis]
MMTTQSIYRLRNLGLPAMKSLEDFASFSRLSPSKIRHLSRSSEFLYKTYKVPKTNGSYRLIAQPSRDLKAVQAWILRNILDELSCSSYSKGFESGMSILDNAKPHIGSQYVLSVDLQDFFPSVSANKVYGVFSSVGYNKEMCVLLTNLCVFKGGLPQGAPTSPKLANLVCSKLDSRIQGYAGPKGITYTRYADDITLSSNSALKIQKAKSFLGTIISDEGFKINKPKTTLSGVKKQKKITGLVLSDNNVGIGSLKYREIRAEIHYLFTGKSDNYRRVNGLLSFVYSVDKKMYTRLHAYISSLKKKFPQSPAASSLNKEIVISR